MNMAHVKKTSRPPPPPPSRSNNPTIAFNDDEYCNSQAFAYLKANEQKNNNNSSSTDCNDADGFDYEKWDDYEDDDDDDDDESVASSPGMTSLQGQRSSDAGMSKETLFFTKSGANAFLFSSDPVPNSKEKITINSSSEGPIWNPPKDGYTCSVASPKKETKFGGMKSFMTYQLVPTFSNIQVSRRYKQFTWLYQRLTEKFTTISIPPLPERPQLVGKFEGDFISNRLRSLQLWVLRMCKHPVVSHADVFLHFLTCTDEKKWSRGKRVAEKDEYIRGRWFATVRAPSLDSQKAEAQINQFSQFVKAAEEGLRQMTVTCEHNMKKHETFKKEYERLGMSFLTLAKSFELDSRPTSNKLRMAMEQTGKTYEDIGLLFGNQPMEDMAVLVEGLMEYRGMLTTFPSSVAIHRGAANNVKEEKVERLSDKERQEIQVRANVITSTVLADMLYFQQERVTDFKEYMCRYLEKQMEFHMKIADKLRDNLQRYKNI